jgi:Holliday junction DNA helicase RuvA
VIESLRGQVETCAPDSTVLRLGSVSLRLGITAQTAHTLRPGEQTELFTHLYMREDLLLLFGFASREERSLFEELLGVTGVGPKVALGLLSGFTPAGLRDAIEREDVTRLVKVPGVGRKTAQRVVLELKGKLVLSAGASPQAGQISPREQELMQVLSGLGYSAAEAAEAVHHSTEVAEQGSDEDRLRAALSYFASH